MSSIGGECVYACEINKYACETYKENFGIDSFGDIKKVNQIPEHDIMCAGFPCPSYSLAGLRKGLKDKRGELIFDLLRVLNNTKPKAFLFENVDGLKMIDNGKTFQLILDKLRGCGYAVYHNILNSKDFGVPQSRKRLFFVGFRDYDGFTSFSFPKASIKANLSSILEKEIDPKYYLSPKAIEGLIKHKERHQAKGNGFGCRIHNIDDVASTIGTTPGSKERNLIANTLSARYYKDGSENLIMLGHTKGNMKQRYQNKDATWTIDTSDSKFGIEVNNMVRKLTPRECARLQGFPDSFKFPIGMSDTQLYIQFGNAVSVPVIKAIGEKMIQFMKIIKLL